jgi:long-chain acyl-CoA synthetase
MLVAEFLEHSADRLPDKIALIFDGQRLNYLQIDKRANRLANWLLNKGIQKQDRVAIFLEPSVEAIVGLFASLKAGGTFVIINPQVRARKVAFILNDCRAKALIVDTARFREVSVELGRCPFLRFIIMTDRKTNWNVGRKMPLPGDCFEEIMNNYSSDRPERRCIDMDLASLIYTSGSTGVPKGVMLTHLNMVSAARSITQYLENTSNDVIMNVLPLSFDYGLYQVLMAFMVGGTVVQEQAFIFPYRTISLMLQEKVTGFPIVPAVAAMLFKLKNLKRHDFPDLRYITSTAQALPPRHIRKLRELFPRARIYSMYGLTECKRVSYLPPEEINRRPTSVGKAMPNTEAFIVDEKGNTISEPGRTGELVVRGSHVMRGYWNRPEETDKVLRPGPVPGENVLYTGDLFRMDEDGFLYFVARKDEMIKVAGALVSPKEVENALHEIADVKEAAVVGVSDEITGEAVEAFVALKKGSRLDEGDIRRKSAKFLESYMIPKYVEIRTSLPKSDHGKILKNELKKAGHDR